LNRCAILSALKKTHSLIERGSVWLTEKIGTPTSLVVHTIFFFLMFMLPLFGLDFEHMLIILTTIVSLEAIYLALFIQMTVNKTSEEIEDVGEDIKEIQEDDEADDVHDQSVVAALRAIERKLNQLQKDVDALKG